METKTLSGKRVLRYPDIRERGFFSNRVSLRRAIQRGDFPAPIQISPNAIGWLASEVEVWLASRPRRIPAGVEASQ